MMRKHWVALKASRAKEIHRFMRIWVQTLVPPVITMTLYFIIFGNLIKFAHWRKCMVLVICSYCAGPDYDGGHY